MTGEVFAKSDVWGNTVCRAESPKYFWAIIAVYARLALTLIFVFWMHCSALNCSMSCYGLLIELLKKWRLGLRMKHSARMRVECDRGRHRVDGARPLRYSAHYLLMPEMEPVKNTQSQDCRFLYVGIFRAVEYFHEDLEYKL